MLLAPFLAVALVLSLAAAVSYLPVSPEASLQKQSFPEASLSNYSYAAAAPTANPESGTSGVASPSSSYGSVSAATPLPSTAPIPAATAAPAPTAIPESGTTSVNVLPALSIIVAIFIGAIAALVFFSEKSLKKEIGQSSYVG